MHLSDFIFENLTLMVTGSVNKAKLYPMSVAQTVITKQHTVETYKAHSN